LKRAIGRKDKIDLPELGIYDIEAKIDTGAYGCALHCHHIKIITLDGEDVLSFQVLDPSHPEYKKKVFHFKHFDTKKVKSSSGVLELRYTIKTDLIIFNKKYRVVFSLTNRKRMKNPILLGRQFLAKRYIVDVVKKDLSFNEKNNSNENSSIIA
jgi:hypothetical protein